MTPAETAVMALASQRFLHVANGYSLTQTIHDAGIPGISSIWADVLHEGPVPGGLSDGELLTVRARHLAEPPDQVADTMAGLLGWRAAIDAHPAYDELILWYEHDLFDQLNLIQVLSRIRQALPTGKPVSLVSIGSFPGRQHFKGMGELTPDELAPLFGARQPVSDAQYALAEGAWLAFRASDPRQIEDVLRADTSALPFLGAALQRHLEEFPSTFNGLSRTEQRLMELARSERVDLWAAFPQMHDRETAFYIGDASFWHVVRELAATAPPMVVVEVTSTEAGRLPRGMIWLTDMGRKVMIGAADRVRQCGVQRWLGGVHLDGSGPLWRWDPGDRRLVHF